MQNKLKYSVYYNLTQKSYLYNFVPQGSFWGFKIFVSVYPGDLMIPYRLYCENGRIYNPTKEQYLEYCYDKHK